MEPRDQEEQDARVEKLWRTLDTQKQGHLDAKGLKNGLKKIDHRLYCSPNRFQIADDVFQLSKMPTRCSRTC